MKGAPKSKKASSVERIPSRPLPDFEEFEGSAIEGIMDAGFLPVALDDANQFGPHAMIMLLFAVASVTAIVLMIPTLL